MPFCTVCKANGEDDSVCETHGQTAYTKCPYHARHPNSSARKVATANSDDDSDIDPELSTALPNVSPSKTRSVGALASSGVAVINSSVTNAELLSRLYDGQITKHNCKKELTARIADADTEAKESKLLNLLKAADQYVPETSRTDKMSVAAQEVAKLQSKHGNLSGLYMATYKQTLHELHVKSKHP